MRRHVVGWFEIYVDDILPAKTFYEAVFEVQLQPLPPQNDIEEMWCFPLLSDDSSFPAEAPGSPGAIVKMAGCPSGGNSTLVYFSCEDCEVQQQRATEHGGSIVRPKFSIGEPGFIALILDPASNMIGLHSRK